MNVTALINHLRAQGITDENVLRSMERIPRHLFVPAPECDHAYENRPLPIGCEQTISQPYIVALMTETLLADGPLARVLEIGTGSGYQAAVLSSLVQEIYTVERIEALCKQARVLLQTLCINNVHVFYDDGAKGLPEYAPFDGIIITAALEAVPQALLEQMAVGGRMIVPVGAEGYQTLRVIRRDTAGWASMDIEPVRFVPFKKGVE